MSGPLPSSSPKNRAGAFAVELIGATRSYGALRAADCVSLQILPGEFFTILGSSGSGKTTTLRLIGGFELPDDGRVLINGADVTAFPAHRRDVHTVFQDYALFPHLTVFENVAFACRLKGIGTDELRNRVTHALELVQLDAHATRKPAQLSGGQQQRVALARAIVDRPAVLLLDEPLSALDAKIRTEVRGELKLLQRSTGITFVYVTHDQEEALTLSDRIAVMRGGRVVQTGSPIEIYEKPADFFVASFVGKANFISGVLRSLNGSRCTVETVEGLVEGFATNANMIPGSKVQVMIRPENLRLSPGSADAREAVIKQVCYLGHGTEYLLAVGDTLFRALELRRRGTTPLEEGATVTYGWSWEEALVFPAEEADGKSTSG